MVTHKDCILFALKGSTGHAFAVEEAGSSAARARRLRTGDDLRLMECRLVCGVFLQFDPNGWPTQRTSWVSCHTRREHSAGTTGLGFGREPALRALPSAYI